MTDGINNIERLRSFYRSRTLNNSGNAVESGLKEIVSELKIANDLKAREEAPITNATGSPYLEDQPFYRQEALFGSPRETEWKKVPSYEETRNKSLSFALLKKLNVL